MGWCTSYEQLANSGTSGGQIGHLSGINSWRNLPQLLPLLVKSRVFGGDSRISFPIPAYPLFFDGTTPNICILLLILVPASNNIWMGNLPGFLLDIWLLYFPYNFPGSFIISPYIPNVLLANFSGLAGEVPILAGDFGYSHSFCNFCWWASPVLLVANRNFCWLNPRFRSFLLVNPQFLLLQPWFLWLKSKSLCRTQVENLVSQARQVGRKPRCPGVSKGFQGGPGKLTWNPLEPHTT